MRKQFSLLFLAFSLLVTPLVAQNSTSFSVGELDPYFSEYLRPAAIALATGMGSGWAHEAGPHKTLGFDISFSATAVQIPTSAMNFSTSKLSGMTDYSFGSATELPTMVSPDAANAQLSKNLSSDEGIPALKIPALNGLDIPYTPTLSLQVAVGLPKGTEVIGRFMPDAGSSINKIGLNSIDINKMSMWGVGVKHNIKQWIPVVSRVPILELSALFAYSKFNFDMTSTEKGITPQTIENASGVGVEADPNPNNSYENQGFEMEMSSITGSLMIGANIPVVHPFVAVGFNKATAKTGLTGMYPVIELNPNFGTSSTDVFRATGPDSDNLYLEVDETFVNFQAGLNFKIAVLSIHAQYTYQQYSMYSVGVAIGLR